MIQLDCLRTTPGEVVSRLAEVLKQEHHVEKVMAAVRQRHAARDLAENRRSVEGLGRPRLEVDTFAYHYWGQRLGYQCWRDEAFLREFERDNPDCRVRARGAKEIQVGYGSCQTPKSRFKKSYG